MNSQPLHNNEVASDKPTRRYFYAKDKSRLLLEADSASPDQLGALLRREGIFSTDLDTWRKERNKGLLAPSSKKKGRPITVDPKDKLIAHLERETARWKERAERAETLVELQKKIAELLKIPLSQNNEKPYSKK
jgi:transposase